MKAKLIICAVTLAWAFWGVCDLHACCVDPVASMSADPSPVCVGCSIAFDASGSYDPDKDDEEYTCDPDVDMINGIRKFEWDWTNDGSYDYTETSSSAPDGAFDGIATHTYSTTGTYTCKVKVTDDDDDCCCDGSGCSDKTDPTTVTFRVVRVSKIVENVAPYTDEGPLGCCIYESVGLKAIASPPGSFPTGEPHWSIVSQPLGANATLTPSFGSATTTLSDITKSGDYVIAATCCGSGDTITVVADGWDASPAISGAAIKKSHDQTWFHIDQSCDLRAKGYDADTLCGTQYADYIALNLTQWTGSPDVFPATGEQVTWDPVEPTTPSGVTIVATIKDDPVNPDGSNTDDGDASASRVLKAYEACADLVVNWANSGGSGNDTVTVYETGPTSDNISANMNDSESIATSVWVSPFVFTDQSFFEPQQPFVKGKWTLKTEPSTADVYTPGKIRVTEDMSASGTLECTINDDEDGCIFHSWDTSVTVTVGVPPVSVSITPNLEVPGGSVCESEGSVALSWGVASEIGWSRESPLSEELERTSENGEGTFQQNFSYAPPSQDFVGDKSETEEALAKVGGKIACQGYIDWSTGFAIPFDADAAMACTSSTVTYYISDPTMSPAPGYYGPEPGY